VFCSITTARGKKNGLHLVDASAGVLHGGRSESAGCADPFERDRTPARAQIDLKWEGSMSEGERVTRDVLEDESVVKAGFESGDTMSVCLSMRSKYGGVHTRQQDAVGSDDQKRGCVRGRGGSLTYSGAWEGILE
jgi:hypothetical protein